MRSWCFDSVATEVDGVTTYDREYGSAEFREVMRKLVGDGVYANPANNMQVTAGGGMTVSVLPGYCWIKGALGIVDEAETLTLDAATASRVDLIVARFDLSLSARDIHLAVLKGTNGSNTAPTLTRNDSIYELQLARVQVSANATNITPANITDTRFNDSVCGIVTGVIDQIDATDLFAQYGAVFDEFMEELGDVLTGDVAGNLLTLIDNHKADTNNPHNVTASQVGLGNVLNEKQYCESNPPPNLAASHIKNTNNPHNVTREQLGIGSSCHQVRLFGGASEFGFTDLIPQAIIATFSYSNSRTQNAGYETVVMPRGSLAEANFDSFNIEASFLSTNNGYTFTITAPTHDSDSIYLGYRFVAIY